MERFSESRSRGTSIRGELVFEKGDLGGSDLKVNLNLFGDSAELADLGLEGIKLESLGLQGNGVFLNGSTEKGVLVTETLVL